MLDIDFVINEWGGVDLVWYVYLILLRLVVMWCMSIDEVVGNLVECMGNLEEVMICYERVFIVNLNFINVLNVFSVVLRM